MTYCKNYCEEEGISTSKLNEAQRTLYYIAENMKMNKSISEDGYKHFQMAIKSLEQESVLDKIRAEIEQEQYAFILDRDFDEGVRFGLMLAYQIIDKYKAESGE